MRKNKLILCLSLLTMSTISFASSYDVSQEKASPERVAIFKDGGKYLVSGYDNGSAYADAMETILNQQKTKRINEISTNNEQERKDLENSIIAETNANIKHYEKLGRYADGVIKYMKSGYTESEAENKAANEFLNTTFEDTYDPNDPSTSYNANSITSSLLDGNSNTSNTSASNNFKQFNELDCSYDEVSNYINKATDPKTKGLALPNYSGTYKGVAKKSAEAIKGKEAAECQTIFDDVGFDSLPDLSIDNILDKIPSLDDFGNKLNDLGGKAVDQLTGMTEQLYGSLRKGICKRLSSDYVGDLAGDLINDQYKESIKGTVLEGTRINNLDKKAGQENFTYKILKNQTGLSNSNLIKSLDVTRDDQFDHLGDYVEDNLDDSLDNLEDQIFG